MANTTKLNELTITVLCESAKMGLKRKHQAQRAGISVGCLYNWLDKGKRGQEPYKELFDRLEKATADGIMMNLMLILRSAKDDRNWQAAAWLLERCHGYYRTASDDNNEDVLLDTDQVNVKDLLSEIKRSEEKLKPFLNLDIED
tara:strand:- start:6521 stop:6952 length:432 start_codon:yes stop_codon:yes gene_type:complete